MENLELCLVLRNGVTSVVVRDKELFRKLIFFRRDFCIMYRNLRHFKNRVSDWKTARRLKRNRMKDTDREMKEVCEGETRAALLDPSGTHRTYRFIEDDANC